MPKTKKIGPKVRVYAEWMPDAAMEHITNGFSFGHFAGANNIDPECWSIWSNRHPELNYVRQWYNVRQLAVRQGDMVLKGIMDETEGLRELVKQLTLERDQLKAELDEIRAMVTATVDSVRAPEETMAWLKSLDNV